MSTVKTDVITAVSTNGDLSLDGLGSGGVSIASTLKMTKGGDIASASPLVIDTDGNYFDVTGTTNFAAMTVEAGNFFMLQFDGALTITHGSGIELPGAANLTTAAGDRLICYATAANTVEVMSVATEAAAAGGGGWKFLSGITPSGDTTLSFVTDITYDGIVFVWHNLYCSAAEIMEIEVSTNAGSSWRTETSANGRKLSWNSSSVTASQSTSSSTVFRPRGGLNMPTDNNNSLCGMIWMTGVTISGGATRMWSPSLSYSPEIVVEEWGANLALNGFRFGLSSTGTYTAGRIDCYGLVQA